MRLADGHDKQPGPGLLVLGEVGHCNICPDAAKAQQTSRVTPNTIEGPGCSKIRKLVGRGSARLEIPGTHIC